MVKLTGWRLLVFFGGVGLGISFLVPLLERIAQIYQLSALVSPLLAGVAVLLILALVIGLLILLWRYLQIFQASPPPVISEPAPPSDKVEAVQETLATLDDQLARIEDEVARQALQIKADDLKANFLRESLRVVVFGVGSAGKTSLVNALLDRALQAPSQRGAIGAAMGTTQSGNVFKGVELAHLENPLEITDCPGILEASALGAIQEQTARTLATEADLILFVIDDDLRQSEFATLKALTEMGKRVLLVFNKIDRYRKSDAQVLYQAIQTKVAPILPDGNVVMAAAAPQSLTLNDGTVIHPKPEINSLVQRIAAILSYEGDELVADNVLLQSQGLHGEIRDAIAQQRQKQADAVIEKYQWLVAGAVFATPLPVVDLLATAAINTQMVLELGKVYDCHLSREQGQEIALSLTRTLVKLGIAKGVTQLVTSLISVTFVGLLLKASIQGVTAAYLTRIAGKSFCEYFQASQQWGDGGINAVVERQFQLNRRDAFLKAFVQEAMERVMTLARSKEPSS
ncbi:MAG: YcjF family protein [Pseudanabaenaceae cyanobacterium]|jgi:GTPase SAR1 family protein